MKLTKNIIRVLKSVWVRTEKYCVVSYHNIGWYTEETRTEMPFNVNITTVMEQRPYTVAGPKKGERSALFRIQYFIETSVRISKKKLHHIEEVVGEHAGKTFFIGGTVYTSKDAIEAFPKEVTCIENAANVFARDRKRGLVIKTNSTRSHWMPFNKGDTIL